MWGISWVNIQMMLADEPKTDYDSEKPDEKKAETEEDIVNLLQRVNNKIR